MTNSQSHSSRRRLQLALIVAGSATVITAFAGLVLFLAGSLVLGTDLGIAHPTRASLSADLLAQGPLGYATWMAILMACGAPVIGLAIFAMLYAGRPHTD